MTTDTAAPATSEPGGNDAPDRLSGLLPSPDDDLAVGHLLGEIAAQAAEADATRTIRPQVIEALKGSDIVGLAASSQLAGGEASVLRIGRELEAVAAACTSTAWVLWNHLSVFHLIVGCLGPDHEAFLKGRVAAGETVCFPAGAGSGVRGVIEGDVVRLNGRGSFGTGGRYADWAGVAFIVVDADGQRREPLDLRFTVVDLSAEEVRIDPNWDGSGVRASATDDIHYTDVVVPIERCVTWFGANRAETLRDSPVVAPRYREDWVGLSDLWLGWMAIGLVAAALDDVASEVRDRRSILGKRMVSHPTVQLNLGRASTLVATAAAAMDAACRQVDDRIESGVPPTEADYLRQMAQSSGAIRLAEEAMDLLRRSQGGNGLRQSGSFERRWRDFQAMPLHINAHQDRVDLRLGRHVLGEEQDPF